MRERLSLAWIDWRFAGRTLAVQSLGRFLLLFLMAFAFLALQLSGGATRYFASQYAVTAVLREAASPEESRGLAGRIAALPSVLSAQYRDPEDAWEEFLDAFPGVETIRDAGGNPLPGYIEIRFRHDRFTAGDVDAVLSALKPVELIEKVLAGEDSLPRLFKVQRAAAFFAWGMFALIAALFLVILKLQEQLRSAALSGDIGFLVERGISERRVAASRAAGSALAGILLSAVAVAAAAASLHFLLRRHPSLQAAVCAPEALLSPPALAASGVFVLCAAILFGASSLLGWTAVRPSGK
ncbi:MAG: permease-like cell division protein FtsX [Thermodesulfobacteriota bacterium]